jgi:hypothetical protein
MCGRFGQAFSEFLDCVSEPKRIVSTSFLSSWLDLNRKVIEDIKQANTRLVNQVLVQLYAGSVQKIIRLRLMAGGKLIARQQLRRTTQQPEKRTFSPIITHISGGREDIQSMVDFEMRLWQFAAS